MGNGRSPWKRYTAPSSTWQGAAKRINCHLALSCLPPGSLCHQELSPPQGVGAGRVAAEAGELLPAQGHVAGDSAQPCVLRRPSLVRSYVFSMKRRIAWYYGFCPEVVT